MPASASARRTCCRRSPGPATAAGERKVLYLTAEKFMYGFVAALRTQTALAFKEALRGIDVLVIDDLQFLQGKSTQAEFCHTLNALIDAGRQVVIASDRPPSRSRKPRRPRALAAGRRARGRDGLARARSCGSKSSKPASPLRARIIRASTCPRRCSPIIAKTVTHNGRDLEGALNRLLAHNKLTGHAVTLEMAEREVRDLIRPQEPKRVKIEDIQRVVARQYNVSRSDLLSSRRTANVVRPRQVAMYLAKTLTLRSLPEIGRRFGGRDHTTVLHAVRKIERPGRQRHGAGRGDRNPEAAIAGIAALLCAQAACKASCPAIPGPRLLRRSPARDLLAGYGTASAADPLAAAAPARHFWRRSGVRP